MRIVRPAHSVIFYRRRPDLADSVYAHIIPGLEKASKVFLIATAPHQSAIEDRLRAGDFDPDILRDAGVLIMLDADETLEKFSKRGAFDEGKFQKLIGGKLPTGVVTHAYGEMVNVLCERGKFDEALELERMWNRLAAKHPFALLCGYHAGAFENRIPADFLRHACKEHDNACSLSGDSELSTIKGALRDRLGADEASNVWQRLVASDTHMPMSFTAMHWLRDNLPQVADQVANIDSAHRQ